MNQETELKNSTADWAVWHPEEYFTRDKEIALRYLSSPHKSLQKLGDEHGISRERVRQICNVMCRKAGVPKPDGKRTYDLPRLKGDKASLHAISSLSL